MTPELEKTLEDIAIGAAKRILDEAKGTEEEKECQMLRNFAEDVSFIEDEFGFSIESSIKIVLAWNTYQELTCG